MSGYETTLAEHEDLLRRYDRLYVLASAERGVVPEPRLRQLLERELEGFQRFLLAHMRAEEEGGYFPEVAQRRPTLTPKLSTLKEDHGRIRRELELLLSQARETPPLADLTRSIKKVLHHVRAHEHAETALLQRVFTNDLGAGD